MDVFLTRTHCDWNDSLVDARCSSLAVGDGVSHFHAMRFLAHDSCYDEIGLAGAGRQAGDAWTSHRCWVRTCC